MLQHEGRPLVFYHFHVLKALKHWPYDVGSAAGRLSPFIRRNVYGQYVRALESAGKLLHEIIPAFRPGYSNRARRSKAGMFLQAVVGNRLLVGSASSAHTSR